jgi:hypothetical protein
MIGPLDAAESNAAAHDGLFHRTNALYYRLLNCGFRLGVSGGSAIGAMPVPMGYNRVYAKIDGPLTVEKYWAAIKLGRSFATSGPMLTMLADKQDLGSTLKLQSGEMRSITVNARVRALHGLEALQLIHSGSIVKTVDLSGKQLSSVLDHKVTWTLQPTRSAWIAARALFRAPDGLLRQAHTSPIYIVVDDKLIAHRADALYMMRWIDRLVEIAQLPDRYPRVSDRQVVLGTYARARAVYQGIADRVP